MFENSFKYDYGTKLELQFSLARNSVNDYAKDGRPEVVLLL